MRLLCIDSSGKAAGIAVCEEEKLLCESFLNIGLTHSQTLLPLLEATLATAGLAVTDMDAIAVSIGPGSFTGLRIGVSMAKGIAQALNIPCIGVSTLEVLAESVRDFDGLICPVMDARRNQVYNALFQGGEDFCRLTSDRAVSVEELGNEIKQKNYKKNIILVGDGAEMCYNDKGFCEQTAKMSANTQTSLCIAALPNRLQRASCIGFAAFRAIGEGQKTVSPSELTPQYLRLSQAQRQRLEREKEKQK